MPQISSTLGEDLQIKQLVPAQGGARAQLFYLGTDLKVTQKDVPFEPTTVEDLTQSQADLLVFADTVTIAEDLINPGAGILIVAREIIASTGTFLDVSAARAADSFLAGVPAQQTGLHGGAPPAGANAATGLNAGTIQLYADKITISGAYTGDPKIRAISLGRALERAVVAAMPTYMGTPNLNSLPLTLPPVGSYAPANAVLSGLGNLHLTSSSYDPDSRTFTVTLGQSKLVITAAVGGEWNVPLKLTFDVTLTVKSVLEDPFTPGAPTVSLVVTNASATCLLTFVQSAFQNLLPGYVGDILIKLPVFAPFASAIQKAILPPCAGAPSLVLFATGGEGGRGEDGAPGAQGKQGTPGQNTDQAVLPIAPPPPQCIGGPGGPGGRGGDPGTPGAGGSGGTVAVGGVTTAVAGALVANGGGPGGSPAWAGAAGPGGPGGTGGTYYVGWVSSVQQVSAPDGPQGPGGSPGTFSDAPGKAGAAGATNLGSTTYDAVAPFASLGQLQIAQQAAKVNYMNAATTTDYQDVIAQYNWLYNVTLVCTTQPKVGDLTPTDIAARAGINAAVAVELARLSRNLDYFGNAANWTPVLTLSYYQLRVNQLISLGTTITTQLQGYESAEAAQQTDALKKTEASLETDLTNIHKSIETLQQQIAQAEALVSKFNDEISQQQFLIQSTITEDEKEAAQSATGCKSVLDIVSAVAAIAGFSAAAAGGIGSVADAEKVIQSATKAITGGQSLLQQLFPSPVDYSSLSNAYAHILADLKSGANSAQIAVDEVQFDQLVGSYFTKQQAVVLEEQVQDLINLAQTRNTLVLNISAWYAQVADMQAQLKQKQAELQNVAVLLAAQNPVLPDLIAFMQRAIQDTLNELVDNLWQENQAYSYWSLDPQPFTLQGLDLGSLSATAGALATDIENYLQRTARPFDKFQEQVITIAAASNVSAFSRLPGTKRLTFSIPLAAGPFSSFYQITAETVAVGLLGVTPPAGTPTNPTLLTVNLVQSGPDVLKSPPPAQTEFTFTHDPRAVPFQYNYTTSNITVTGDIGDPTQGFNGLSPFATWTIDFDFPENRWLDLSALTGVTLTFSGYLLGRPAPESSDQAPLRSTTA